MSKSFHTILNRLGIKFIHLQHESKWEITTKYPVPGSKTRTTGLFIQFMSWGKELPNEIYGWSRIRGNIKMNKEHWYHNRGDGGCKMNTQEYTKSVLTRITGITK